MLQTDSPSDASPAAHSCFGAQHAARSPAVLRGGQVEPRFHPGRTGARNAQTIVLVICLEPIFLTPPPPLHSARRRPTRRRRPQLAEVEEALLTSRRYPTLRNGI